MREIDITKDGIEIVEALETMKFFYNVNRDKGDREFYSRLEIVCQALEKYVVRAAWLEESLAAVMKSIGHYADEDNWQIVNGIANLWVSETTEGELDPAGYFPAQAIIQAIDVSAWMKSRGEIDPLLKEIVLAAIQKEESEA